MAIPKPTEYYRFRHQPGRNIQVLYLHEGRWLSTGTENPEDARAWAERNLYRPGTVQRVVTFKAYSNKFFTYECPWLDRMGKNRYDLSTIERYRRQLMNYLWPRFGSVPLTAITRRDIDL